jgi:hypothetical protein
VLHRRLGCAGYFQLEFLTADGCVGFLEILDPEGFFEFEGGGLLFRREDEEGFLGEAEDSSWG